MPKEAIWILIVAVGVFFGALGYEKFTEYRLRVALQSELEQMQQAVSAANASQIVRIQENQRRREERKEEARKREFDQTTACAINEDAGVCGCISMKTGQKVHLALDECKRRARAATP